LNIYTLQLLRLPVSWTSLLVLLHSIPSSSPRLARPSSKPGLIREASWGCVHTYILFLLLDRQAHIFFNSLARVAPRKGQPILTWHRGVCATVPKLLSWTSVQNYECNNPPPPPILCLIALSLFLNLNAEYLLSQSASWMSHLPRNPWSSFEAWTSLLKGEVDCDVPENQNICVINRTNTSLLNLDRSAPARNPRFSFQALCTSFCRTPADCGVSNNQKKKASATNQCNIPLLPISSASAWELFKLPLKKEQQNCEV
jgi:hypothetical protein